MADAPPEAAPAIRTTAMACGAASVTSRHCGGPVPVVAADGLGFTAVRIGDAVSFRAENVATGRTAMTLAIDIWRRDRHGEGPAHAAAGRFSLVSMGAGDRPLPLHNLV